jgi:hypothetical protein
MFTPKFIRVASIFIEGIELCPELELVTALIINCTENKL